MGGPPGREEILNKRRLSGRFGAIRLIPGGNGGTYPHCNSVWIEEAGVLIDPASDRGRLEELRRLGAVKAVWLSHGHEDHFADLDLFDDCPLWVSREEAPPLESLEGLLDAYGIGEPDHRAYWRRVFEERFHFRPRSPSRFFRDGEVIDLGSETVQVIVTPGHTPGHAAFLFRKTGALFLGDYDLTPFGPWYGDAGSSIEETLRSIERLRGIDASLWIPSHGPGWIDAPPGPLWDRYGEVVHERERKLLLFLSEPRSFREIVRARIVYGKPREPAAFYDYAEGALMGKHLARLGRRGLVRETDGFYVRTG